MPSSKLFSKGATFFEFTVIVLFVGLLCAATLRGYFVLRERTEQAVITGVTSSLNSAITIYTVEHFGKHPKDCETVTRLIDKSSDYTFSCIS